MRKKCGDNGDSKLWSMDGNWWRSMPEACMANFLYAHGIEYTKGTEYSKDFKDEFGVNAWYDLHFKTSDGEWINVEIWGDNPGGKVKEKYENKRKLKEKFNKEKLFLGVQYIDCYEEEKLKQILQSYFKKPLEVVNNFIPQFKSTSWSMVTEVKEYLNVAVSHNHFLPAVGWFTKTGIYKDRKVEEWESEFTYSSSSMFSFIQKLGGIKHVAQVWGYKHFQKSGKMKRNNTKDNEQHRKKRMRTEFDDE